MNSLDVATRSMNFFGLRSPPHRPQRLSTVVGVVGESARSSLSALARGLVVSNGECRSVHTRSRSVGRSLSVGPPYTTYYQLGLDSRTK